MRGGKRQEVPDRDNQKDRKAQKERQQWAESESRAVGVVLL